MKNDIAVKVNQISKQYTIGNYGAYLTLRDQLAGLFGSNKLKAETFWALENVSFDVKQGEVVGIIGSNGAGKSTLLKVISRITEPTSGEIRLRGRVASLLEVGTGFNKELTGRENVYLNGSILGMTRKEINKRFDEIVAFSGVEKFIDMPVKRYSSGMHVRLAFAVAAHLESEILLIDEVLAVGDAQFQRKCLGKMKDVATSGRTVLFVSHNMTAVNSLCENAILLDHGKLVSLGNTQQIIDRYLKVNDRNELTRRWKNKEKAPGNEFLRVISASIINKNEKTNLIRVDQQFSLQFDCIIKPGMSVVHLAIHCISADGTIVFISGCEAFSSSKKIVRAEVTIPAHFLNDITYRIKLFLVEQKKRVITEIDNILVFNVTDTVREIGYMGKTAGVVHPQLTWGVKTL